MESELSSLETATTIFAESRHAAAMDKLLAWPHELLFPVLDLARIMCLDASAAAYFAARMWDHQLRFGRPKLRKVIIMNRIVEIVVVVVLRVSLALSTTFINGLSP